MCTKAWVNSARYRSTSGDDKWVAAKHCGRAKLSRISDTDRLRSSLQFRYINNQSLLFTLPRQRCNCCTNVANVTPPYVRDSRFHITQAPYTTGWYTFTEGWCMQRTMSTSVTSSSNPDSYLHPAHVDEKLQHGSKGEHQILFHDEITGPRQQKLSPE